MFIFFLLLPIFTQFLYHFMTRCSYMQTETIILNVYLYYYLFSNEYIHIFVSRLFNAFQSVAKVFK